MEKILFSGLIFFGSCAYAFAQDDKDKASPGFSASEIQGTYRLERLAGEAVTIWKDQSNSSNFFFPPVLLPDWKRFEKLVERKCDTKQNNELVSVKLPIDLNDKFYENEIRENLEEDGVPDASIGAIPHDNIQIFLSPNAIGNQLIFELNSNSRGIASSPTVLNYVYDSTILAKLGGTCTDLKSIISQANDGEDIISGRLFADGLEYDTTYLSANLIQEFAKQSKVKIFGDEQLVRKLILKIVRNWE